MAGLEGVRPVTLLFDREDFINQVLDEIRGTDALNLIKGLDAAQQCWDFTHTLYLHFKELEKKRLQEEGEVPYGE